MHGTCIKINVLFNFAIYYGSMADERCVNMKHWWIDTDRRGYKYWETVWSIRPYYNFFERMFYTDRHRAEIEPPQHAFGH